MHKAQNRLQVPVPNIQLPVPKKEALETSDVDSSSSSSSSSTIKVPIFSHLCAFDTQNSLQTVHKQKKRCLHRRGSGCTQVLAQKKNGARHNACMRGKFLPAKKKKNPNACKDKRSHNACMRGEALASKEKEKDASESAIYTLCCMLHI